MESAFPRNIYTSAHDSRQVLMFEGKSCSVFGSGSHLVIKAHQQLAVNSFTRSRSDFLETLHSSALAESPNVSQNPVFTSFTKSIT